MFEAYTQTLLPPLLAPSNPSEAARGPDRYCGMLVGSLRGAAQTLGTPVFRLLQAPAASNYATLFAAKEIDAPLGTPSTLFPVDNFATACFLANWGYTYLAAYL